MRSGRALLPTIRISSCPICKGTDARLVHPATRDRWFGAPGTWSFRECRTCKGLWLDPCPTPAALPRIYGRYYTHNESLVSQQDGSAWQRLRHHLPWHAADRLGEVGYLDGVRPGRVLDVGCGNGALLCRLALSGWSAVGLDRDVRAVEAARGTVDGDVRVGTIDDIDEAASFDAVVMFHVLEHVYDPLHTLIRARELLRPGGVLSIATPNALSWLHQVYADQWRGLEPPRHLQVFAEPGLRALLREAGFGRAKIFTTPRNAALLSYASEKSFGTRSMVRRVRLLLKAELLQAIEWIRLRSSPHCGEELVAIAERDRTGGGTDGSQADPSGSI